MIVATHQPNFLPYPGFWFKVDAAEEFGMTTDVKFDYGGYQNRVPLGDGWLTIPVPRRAKNDLIHDVLVSDSFRSDDLIATIKGRMPKKQYPFLHRLDPILEEISALDDGWGGTQFLCRMNSRMIRVVAALLGITTKIHGVPVARYHGETKHDRLFERLRRMWGGGVYVAGVDTASYTERDRIPPEWKVLVQSIAQDAPADTGQSILHFIAKYEDPLTEVRTRFRLTPLI